MKKISKNLLLLLLLSSIFMGCNGQATPDQGNIPQKDEALTTRKAVSEIPIIYSDAYNYLPEDWKKPPINAAVNPLDTAEIGRCEKASLVAMAKYHPDVLKWNLDYLVWVKSLEFYGAPYGGTNSTKNLYLANDGEAEGYSEHYLEGSFHHEFSSILLRNYTTYFDQGAWDRLLPVGFSYGEGGTQAILDGKASQGLDESLNELGFVDQYATSDAENDLNEIAQNLFAPEEVFWERVDKYPALKKKVAFVIDFYHQIWEVWNEQLFRTYDVK
ncbi:MAG: hypothetical protein H6581_20810 [Bacteroidia bacterium]|nr:hypothetical protein [Bacteroidia bacterium]